MKYFYDRGAACWRCVVLLWCMAGPVLASDITSQTIMLSPGWNAIYVELAPDDGDSTTTDDEEPAQVFALPDIEMVWAYPRPENTVQYITQPSEIGINDPDWRVYIPAGQPASALTNLFAIAAGRVYLVKLAGAVAQPLVIQGRPDYSRIQWRTESFNLVGFYADPDPQKQVSFAEFLAIPASSNPAIFRLSGAAWESVGKNATVEHGRGYWVYNDGTITRNGPLDVGDTVRNGIGFGESGSITSFDLRNSSASNLAAVTLGVSQFPLQYFNGYGGASGADPLWVDVNGLTLAINSGREKSLLLAVDRSQVQATTGGILSASGVGMRIQLPLSADPMTAGHDGLWLGTAVLNAVSNVNAIDPAATEPTGSELTLKLLLHSGAGGVHLLKQVYILGDYRNSAAPGTVLVTDDLALPDFVPLELARGENRGHRLSSAGFDFAGTKLPLTGSFDTGLSGQILLDAALPTHPMKHRRNPDHDNLRDDNGTPLPASGLSAFDEEVWNISRQITLTPDQLLDPTPGSGMGRITGVYQEVISGMHKQPVVMAGRFNLRRVSQIGILDPVLQSGE